MAGNMYIKLDDIKGETTAKGHKEEIELLSWNHGFSQPTSPTRSTAGAGTVEQANHQNLTFSKYLDAATDSILSHCWSGKQVKKALLTCFRADGQKKNEPVKYLEVEMEHVVISNYSISGGPGDVPVENVSLDYGVVTYKYMPQKHADGTGDGAKPIKHDLETREVG